MSMEQQKKRDYEIYWPHVILVGAIALVLVLIGVVIGVNIGKSKKYKPVPVTGQGYTWTLQPGAEAQMIYTNFWQFAKASYVLVGDIPNCEFYKIVKEVPRNDFQTDNFYMEDGDSTIMAYHAGDGSRLSELAVDVSSYQAELDWDALKQAGVTIAFIRVGYRGYGSEGKLVADDAYRGRQSSRNQGRNLFLQPGDQLRGRCGGSTVCAESGICIYARYAGCD